MNINYQVPGNTQDNDWVVPGTCTGINNWLCTWVYQVRTHTKFKTGYSNVLPVTVLQYQVV